MSAGQEETKMTNLGAVYTIFPVSDAETMRLHNAGYDHLSVTN